MVELLGTVGSFLLLILKISILKPLFLNTFVQCLLHTSLGTTGRHLTLRKDYVPGVVPLGPRKQKKLTRNTVNFCRREQIPYSRTYTS